MQPQTPYQLYHHATETINPNAQIIMLYGSAINYVKQAKLAIEKKDFDRRYMLIEKSMSIIHGLRACLDCKESGEIMQAMDRYYVAIDNLMVEVQCTDDSNTCDAIIENLERIRNAWEEINNYSAVFAISENEIEEGHKNFLI